MVSNELDLNETLLTEPLTRENIFSLKNQIYTSKANYEKLENKIKELRASISSEQDSSVTKKNSLILGICLWISGNVEEAFDVLAGFRSDKVASYFLGKCYQEREEYEKAIECFESSKQANGDDFEIELNIAETQRLSGDPQSALKMIQKLSKGHDDNANLHYQWAHCLDNLGEYDEALTHYNRTLEIDPNHASSLFRLAYYYDLSGEDEKALEYYEKCVETVPLYTNAMINLGLLYEDNDNYEKAISCFYAVLRSYPNHKTAKLFLKDAEAGLNMRYDDDKVKKHDKEIEVLNIPISDFELSVRSKNCLERMGIITLDDLTKVTEYELLSYKNFGETSLTEIKHILNQKGLRLGQAVESDLFIDSDGGVEDNEQSKTISEIELSDECRNAIQEMGIGSISDLASKTETELLEQDGFTQAFVDEINNQLDTLGLKLHSGNNVGQDFDAI
ncbi:MAG: tetratricopeptide repeat protein [Candidatus Scalindua rubra]|uniref:Putative RNA polymerase alpha subunit n=1 Tax=Candidatus Scalindua brodae TaxID=237368 RepID=A0A0B0EE74_9BACT|nr:MAG: putative RNA polymerase alpha subunit [Candidatus Scalindua brodae]MBZ0109540.1 tetratricopeptide repeat protein [Candidatus Scalindua rubra]